MRLALSLAVVLCFVVLVNCRGGGWRRPRIPRPPQPPQKPDDDDSRGNSTCGIEGRQARQNKTLEAFEFLKETVEDKFDQISTICTQAELDKADQEWVDNMGGCRSMIVCEKQEDDEGTNTMRGKPMPEAMKAK